MKKLRKETTIKCCVEDCHRLVRARGMCTTHLNRIYRKGTPELTIYPTIGTCSIPGCEDKVRAKGLCQTHYNRFYQRRYKFMYPAK